MKSSIPIVLAILAFLLFPACNDKTPPSDIEFKECIQIVHRLDSLSRLKEITSDEANKRIESEIAGLDLDYMTLDQVKEVSEGGMLYRYNALRNVCEPSFLELVKDPGLDGAIASANYTVNFPMPVNGEDAFQNQLRWVEVYRNMIMHPAIGELMISDDRLSSTVFGRLQFVDPKAIGKSGLIQDMIPLLDKPMSKDCGSSCVIFFDVVCKPDVACTKEIVQEVRKKVLIKTRETLSLYQSDSTLSKNRTEHLEHVIAYLSGASSKGELIAYPAPQIHFDYGTLEKVDLLSELKGKVVIIDFWATWCSPCIGSFPNIRALQERYKDYQVVILGITSLQGSHTDQLNKRRIDTKGNPELEYSLMDQFIKDMDITWEIAFSKESQFNEEFGVRGIPHVAIIDPEGIVRYNRLRPYDPPWHEAEKIDELLTEAGLDCPVEPMDKANFSEIEY